MIRLQKVMADRGVASRRGAEEMISGGRVRVNGELITTLGTRVAEDAHIELDVVRTADPRRCGRDDRNEERVHAIVDRGQRLPFRVSRRIECDRFDGPRARRV